MQFIVGTKQQGRSDHLIVDAEDALAAALKAKSQAPELLHHVRPPPE